MDYYLKNWELYWKSITASHDFAPWDHVSSDSIKEDMANMLPYFRQDVPLVDLGCGSGIESKALSKAFNQVIGVDVSAAVIDQINQQTNPPNTHFEQLDILNKQQVLDFRERFGTCNIYMRGVLQQIQAEDRVLCLKHLKLLMGSDNYLYLKEISPDAKLFFKKVILKKKRIPPHLHRVLVQQVTQLVGVSDSDIVSLFVLPTFHIQQVNKGYLELFFDEEDILHVPATVAIIGT